MNQQPITKSTGHHSADVPRWPAGTPVQPNTGAGGGRFMSRGTIFRGKQEIKESEATDITDETSSPSEPAGFEYAEGIRQHVLRRAESYDALKARYEAQYEAATQAREKLLSSFDNDFGLLEQDQEALQEWRNMSYLASDAANNLFDEKYKFSDDVGLLLRAPNPATIPFEYDDSYIDEDINEYVQHETIQQGDFKEVWGRLTSMIDQSVIETSKIAMVNVVEGAAGMLEAGGIFIGHQTGENVLWHEMGHWIEEHNPHYWNRVTDFLAERHPYETAGHEGAETVKIDEDGYPLLGNSYRSYKDDYIDPYMGRVYTDDDNVNSNHPGETRYATEITSTGLELLRRDPGSLATGDPEMFNHLISWMHGIDVGDSTKSAERDISHVWRDENGRWVNTPDAGDDAPDKPKKKGDEGSPSSGGSDNEPGSGEGLPEDWDEQQDKFKRLRTGFFALDGTISESDTKHKFNAQRKANREYLSANVAGVTDRELGKFLNGWEYNTNPYGMNHLQTQEEAADLFDIELSSWQAENLAKARKPRDRALAKKRKWKAEFAVPFENRKDRKARDEDTPRLKLRNTLQAMYNRTQDWFNEAGVTHVRMYRGMRLPQDKWDTMTVGEGIQIDDNAISPWSGTKVVSENYATAGGAGATGVVFEQVVPVERILTYYRTGMGNPMDDEFHVLGQKGKPTVRVVMKTNDTKKSVPGGVRNRDISHVLRDEHGRWIDTPGVGNDAPKEQSDTDRQRNLDADIKPDIGSADFARKIQVSLQEDYNNFGDDDTAEFFMQSWNEADAATKEDLYGRYFEKHLGPLKPAKRDRIVEEVGPERKPKKFRRLIEPSFDPIPKLAGPSGHTPVSFLENLPEEVPFNNKHEASRAIQQFWGVYPDVPKYDSPLEWQGIANMVSSTGFKSSPPKAGDSLYLGDGESMVLTQAQAEWLTEVPLAAYEARLGQIRSDMGLTTNMNDPKSVLAHFGYTEVFDAWNQREYGLEKLARQKGYADDKMTQMIANLDPSKYSGREISAAFDGYMDQRESMLGVRSLLDAEEGTEDFKIATMFHSLVTRPFRSAHGFAMRQAVALGQIDPELGERLSSDVGTQTIGGWEDLPEELYHTTTNVDAILNDRLRSRKELGQTQGLGLGGGEDDTISFTEDVEVGRGIERALHEAWYVTNGMFSVKDMFHVAEGGGAGVGKPWAKELAMSIVSSHQESGIPDNFSIDNPEHRSLLSREVQEILDVEDGLIEPPEPRNNISPSKEDYLRKKAWDVWSGSYSWTRESAGGHLNPLFFSTDWKGLAASNPEQFQTLKLTPRKGAKGYLMGSLGEYRTVGGQTVAVTEAINHFDYKDRADYEEIVGWVD